MSDDLSDRLRALGLHASADSLNDIVATATKRRWAPIALLEYLAQLEERQRAGRSLQRRMARSKLGRIKPMADFDWNWPTKVPADAIHAALALGFLPETKNIVIVGAQGLGKTMIAQNIVHNAVQNGHSALFVTAADLVLDLCAQESAQALERRIKHYCRFSCLCIDEIGYLAYEQRAADLLYQIVNKRYELKPLVLTTNKTFSDWASIFPGAACATALIDRVVHHADIIHIEGKSYRLRESTHKAKKATKRKPDNR